MKRFIITSLFVGLLATASAVWASGDNQKDKVPAKTEKTTATVAPAKGTMSACCAEKKDASCAKKDGACTAKTGGKKACCADKKGDAKGTAACCSNKGATNDAKSSGKKAN